MPNEATISIVEKDDLLLVTAEFPGTTAAAVVSAFCRADQVRQWWGGELTFAPHPGAPYIVDFPTIGATLRGEVLEYAPEAGRLSFSWAFDHEPELDPFRVTLHATEAPGGAHLHLTHGPYPEQVRSELAGHREGWEFFLPRLARHLAGDQP